MITKFQFTLMLFFSSVVTLLAQNSLINYEWSASDENSYRSVVSGTDPFGVQTNLLEITPDGNWRGYQFRDIVIDPNKTYRFSFWAKGSKTAPSYTFAGKIETSNGLINSAGETASDYYIQSSWTIPTANDWYLYVGFIKGANDTSSYTGEVYTTNAIFSSGSNDYKFASGISTIHFGASNNSADSTNKIFLFDFQIKEATNDSYSDLLNPDNINPPSTGTSNKLNLSGLNAEQSSTYYSSVASKAIDGITAGSGSSNITHTNTAVNNWWRLDLGQDYDLTRIDIYNRIDCCSDRLAGTKVYLGSVDSYSPNDYQQVGNTLTGSPAMQQLDFIATGRYIMISQHDKGSSILSLNEIEAYGTLHTTTNDGGDTTTSASVWTTNGNNINFSSGKVGIGTATPGEYELAVNGEIRSKEVRVETANWPDYVFAKNYKLPTLKQVENHINEKGHLINIPSAEEAQANGVELGEMNRLLLEKLEELTLYIIDLQNQINKLKN